MLFFVCSLQKVLNWLVSRLVLATQPVRKNGAPSFTCLVCLLEAGSLFALAVGSAVWMETRGSGCHVSD